MGKRLVFLIVLKYLDQTRYLKGWCIHDGFVWVEKEDDAMIYPLDRTLTLSDEYLDPTMIFRREALIYPIKDKLTGCQEISVELHELRTKKIMKQTYSIPRGWFDE